MNVGWLLVCCLLVHPYRQIAATSGLGQEASAEQGTALYSLRSEIVTDTTYPVYLQVVDLNGDGNLDVVYNTAVNHNDKYNSPPQGLELHSDIFYWAEGRGDGTFKTAKQLTDAGSTRRRRDRFLYTSFEVVDIDGDEDLDLVFCDSNNAYFQAWKNEDMQKRSPLSLNHKLTHNQPYMMVRANRDVDMDGRNDLIGISPENNIGVFWMQRLDGDIWTHRRFQGLQNGDPVKPSQKLDHLLPTSIQTSDLNGDTRVDVVVSIREAEGQGTKLIAYLQREATEWSWHRKVLADGEATHVHIEENFGGGRPVILTTNQETGKIMAYALKNDSPLDESDPITKELGIIEGARGLITADLDGDGDIDIVVSSTEAKDYWSSGYDSSKPRLEGQIGKPNINGRVVWFENYGRDADAKIPNFRTEKKIYESIEGNPRWVGAGDIDGDGQTEVVVALQDRIAWFGRKRPQDTSDGSDSQSGSATVSRTNKTSLFSAATLFKAKHSAVIEEMQKAEQELIAEVELDGEAKTKEIRTDAGRVRMYARRTSNVRNLQAELPGGVRLHMPSNDVGFPDDVLLTSRQYPSTLMESNATLESEITEISFSQVVGGEIYQLRVEDLEEKILIELPLVSAQGRRLAQDAGDECRRPSTCQFWDEVEQVWKSDGIESVYSQGAASLTCLTSHLTAFGAVTDTLVNTFACANLAVFTSEGLDLFLGEEPRCGGPWLEHHAGVFYVVLVLLTCLFIMGATWMECRAQTVLKRGEMALLVSQAHLRQQPEHQKLQPMTLGASHDSLDDGESSLQSHIVPVSETSSVTRPLRRGTSDTSIGFAPKRKLYQLCDTFFLAGKLSLHPKDVKVLAFLVRGEVVEDEAHRRQIFSQTLRSKSRLEDNRHDDSDCASESYAMKGRLPGKNLHGDPTKEYFNFENTTESSKLDSWTSTFVYVFLAQWKLRNVLIFSIVSPYTVRVLFFTSTFWSSGFLASFFFQASGTATQLDAECDAPSVPFLRMVIVGMVTGFVSLLMTVIFGLMADRRRFVLMSSDTQKKSTIRHWHLVDAIFRAGVVLYMFFCIVYTGLFLAQVKDKDRHAFTVSFMAGVLQDNFLLPVTLAMILTCVQEYRKRQHPQRSGEVELDHGDDGTTHTARIVTEIPIPVIRELEDSTGLQYLNNNTLKNDPTMDGSDDESDDVTSNQQLDFEQTDQGVVEPRPAEVEEAFPVKASFVQEPSMATSSQKIARKATNRRRGRSHDASRHQKQPEAEVIAEQSSEAMGRSQSRRRKRREERAGRTKSTPFRVKEQPESRTPSQAMEWREKLELHARERAAKEAKARRGESARKAQEEASLARLFNAPMQARDGTE